MSAFNERAVAIAVLTEVTDNAAYANIALRKALAQHNDADPRAKAFVTELVNETLRHLLWIDHILNTFSQTPVKKMKPFIRVLLRVSVCQLRCMDRVPPSAAVNEAVILAKKRGFTNLSGFINGVLRAVVREPEKPALPSFDKNPLTHMSLAYSYPVWLVEALVNWLGPERAHAFCAGSHTVPSVTVFTNIIKTAPDALAERLRAEGAECAPGTLHAECLMLRRTADITRFPSFREGLFHVMDEGALTAVKALAPRPGMRVADLCAAPGGKTFACACLMADQGRIDATDIHPHKIGLLNETASRLGLTCVVTAIGDAEKPSAKVLASADAVLLDAPCSGLGIIRKRPDIKYARKPEDIRMLAEKQRVMLSAAAVQMKPGSVLVYCTCTVSREENIDNVRWFVENHPFKIEPLESVGLTAALPGAFVEDGCLQLLPGPSHDGFFVARLRRV